MGLDPDLEAVLAVVPGWRGHESTITPIEAGRTNRNFRVEVDSEAFFLRLSDKDTSLLGIDRVAEYEAALAAAAAGVGPEILEVGGIPCGLLARRHPFPPSPNGPGRRVIHLHRTRPKPAPPQR